MTERVKRLGHKRYALPCVVCRDLYPAWRNDSRTCSPTCRVRLHRGAVDPYALAAAHASAMLRTEVPALDVRRVDAAVRLRPDLAARVDSGAVGLGDIDDDVYAALMALYAEAAGNEPRPGVTNRRNL